MPDYNKGKIYTIRCRDDTSLIYVGSTTQRLSQRWTDHKSNCNNQNNKEYNKTLYVKIREVGQDRFYIELYQDHPCEKKEQLNRKEGEVMRELKATMNKQVAGRTHKEWCTDNRENIKEKKKEYNEQNKERISKRQSEYDKNRSFTCECGCIVKGHINRHKKTQNHINLMNAKLSETTN